MGLYTDGHEKPRTKRNMRCNRRVRGDHAKDTEREGNFKKSITSPQQRRVVSRETRLSGLRGMHMRPMPLEERQNTRILKGAGNVRVKPLPTDATRSGASEPDCKSAILKSSTDFPNHIRRMRNEVKPIEPIISKYSDQQTSFDTHPS